MVKDHYANLGFAHLDGDDGGPTRWVLATDTDISAAPMTVRRVGEDAAQTAEPAT